MSSRPLAVGIPAYATLDVNSSRMFATPERLEGRLRGSPCRRDMEVPGVNVAMGSHSAPADALA